jgi:cytidyltransferase-like protein
MDKKIEITKEEIHKLKKLRLKKKKIVLCHGAFDLIHPGHLKHFEESKRFGDILVVTITSDKYIKKGLHNPFYDQNTRLNYIKQLKIVDEAFIVNEATAVSPIETIKPNFYCKGVEYQNKFNDVRLAEEISALKKCGGKVKYLGKNVKSSSDILSRNFFKIGDQELKNAIKTLKKINIEKEFEKLKKIKVLIVGEVILDEYTQVRTQGISPKSSTVSCIKLNSVIMPGGALATHKYVSSITKNSCLISIVNRDLHKKFKDKFKFDKNIISSNNFPKIIKTRLTEDIGNNVIKKIFTINDYEESLLSPKDEIQLIKKINYYAKKCDLIIVQDFGHGLFSENITNLLHKYKNKLSINIQANSLNYGFNIIGKKFKKAKMFSLDERELQLYSGSRELNYKKELKKLINSLKAKFGYLTLGNKFSMFVNQKGKSIKVPKLNNKAVDTMGAGDIFHATASLLSCTSKNDFLNLFLSQIAGAHAVSIIGNSDYPKINNILKSFKFYLNSVKGN